MLTDHVYLAYGGWARSTIGSQNFGVLCDVLCPNETITAFFLAANKNRNSAQVPLASTSSSITGLIWRGTAYSVQNNTTILTGDTRRTTSEFAMLSARDPFWRQNRSLETQNGSYFSLFAN